MAFTARFIASDGIDLLSRTARTNRTGTRARPATRIVVLEDPLTPLDQIAAETVTALRAAREPAVQLERGIPVAGAISPALAPGRSRTTARIAFAVGARRSASASLCGR